MGSIGAIFTSTYQHKAAKSMAKLISQSYHKITAGCLLVKGRWSHLKTTRILVDVWEASETSHNKISLGNVQHQYLAELFVKVYSYCWWWKVCLDVVCVEAGVSLIQSHSCMCSCHQSYGFLLKLNILHVQILSFGSCSYMELIGKLTYIIHPSPFM